MEPSDVTEAATPAPALPSPDSATMSADYVPSGGGPKDQKAILTGRASLRYEVLAELGRGGMGAVYRVLDRDLRREVALKVMLDFDANSAARFVEEARATAQLQHPGIVPVYDIGLDEQKNLFFTMKLVEGETLAHVLDRARADDPGAREFTPFRLLQIFVEIARTVDYAHERGIIHRDLKPQNVMIGRHGEVQVLDWGLAKVLREAQQAAAAAPPAPEKDTVEGVSAGRQETVVGTVSGTPAYMAPEQAAGDPGKIGPHSDVYSLGATLYRIVTGRAPFEKGTSAEVVQRVLSQVPPRPREVDRECPREVEAIVLRAMSRTPEGRYGSALALAEDVQAFLEHRPVAAYPEGALRRATK